MSIQIVLALAAWKLGRPVKTQWTRGESIIGHHKRHASVARAKWGAMKDGRIVEEDGITELRFCVILSATEDNDKVHGIVLSPSHTNERTANEMSSAKSNTFTYDFTTGADQVYGGIVAHKELAPGIWGMMSGDGNHDGQVGNNDKNDVWLAENGNSGYYFGDFNRDGIVDDIDIIDYWKPNAGRGNKID